MSPPVIILILLLIVGVGGASVAVAYTDDTPEEDDVPDDTEKPPYLPNLVASPSWTKYDGLFKTYALQFGIPWLWPKAICVNETLLGTDKYYLSHGFGSSDGKSWGLMQVTLATGMQLAGGPITSDFLRDDRNSIMLGCKLLAQLADTFGSDDLESIVKSYNQGPTNTKRGKTYADPYWERFQKNLDLVTENS